MFGGSIPSEIITPDETKLSPEELEEITKSARQVKKSTGSDKASTRTTQKSYSDSSDSVQYVNINDIKPNANQPRKYFDESKIEELADSILEHGIIQPLILRPAKVGYEIVAGERRYRAARKAGLKRVPSIVREFTDEENMVIAIVENMQREDLDPIEEAEGLNQIIKVYGFTQEETSKSVGKSRPYIANSLRLLTLPEDIKKLISDGTLTAGHGRALLAVKDDKKRQALAERIVRDSLSVRQAENLAQGKSKGSNKNTPKKKPKNRDIMSVEDELKSIFGTRVNITGTGKRGAIEIEYYSTEELNRLIDLLRTTLE